MPMEEAFRNADMNQTKYDTLYQAVFVGEPGNGGTECSGTGYARIAVTFGAASAGVRSSTAEHVFTAGVGGWQAGVNWGALFDAPAAGNQVSRDQLDGTRDMSVEGAKITFAAGAIQQGYPT